MEEKIESKIKEFKKYYKLKNSSYDAKIQNILEEFIRDKKLIIYGGTAIDVLLRLKGHIGIYDYEYDDKDYDVFSPNALEDIKELAEIFKRNGTKYVKITSAIKEGTYKLFLDVEPSAVIDITQIDLSILPIDKLNFVEVDGLIYNDPDQIKIDQYSNLCSNLFADMHRHYKASTRVMLMEEYYPLKKAPVPVLTDSIRKKYKFDPKTYKTEYILSGDIAYWYYTTGELVGKVITYSYDSDDKGLPLKGHIPYRGEMLYRSVIFDDIVVRVASIDLLIYTYYRIMFLQYARKDLKITNIRGKIKELIKIRENERTTDLLIYVPPFRRKYEKKISSIYSEIT